MKVRGPFAIQSSGILVHQVYHLNTFFFTFSTPQKRQVGIASCYVGWWCKDYFKYGTDICCI